MSDQQQTTAPAGSGVTLNDRVKIQAEVLIPIHQELVRTVGKSQADAVMRQALLPWARSFAGEVCAHSQGSPLTRIKNFVSLLADQGLQEVTFVKETEQELRFHMTGCRAAEFYRAAGVPELGELFVCEMDYEATRTLDPSIVLERPQTLMRGGKYCDFRFSRKQSKE